MGSSHEAALLRATAEGQAAWPELALLPESFAAHLARHWPVEAPAGLHAGDLWLACACAQGVRGAAEALEVELARAVSRALAGMDGGPAFADEVRQSVREKLLFGRGGTGPAIASYSGEGALSSWLKVAARRAALNLRERKELPQASEEALLEAKSALPDPEVEHLRDRYRVEFRAAFHAALAGLPPRERLLLKQHYVDGLSGARIAELQGVAPATVTRALQAAREILQKASRRQLEERLRLSRSQIDSLAGLVLSRLDVSLSRVLAKD